MADKVQYKFAGRSGGTIIYNEGYTTLVIIDQIAEVDPANAEQVAMAERHGGKLVVVNVVEEKTTKKPTESDRKK